MDDFTFYIVVFIISFFILIVVILNCVHYSNKNIVSLLFLNALISILTGLIFIWSLFKIIIISITRNMIKKYIGYVPRDSEWTNTDNSEKYY